MPLPGGYESAANQDSPLGRAGGEQRRVLCATERLLSHGHDIMDVRAQQFESARADILIELYLQIAGSGGVRTKRSREASAP